MTTNNVIRTRAGECPERLGRAPAPTGALHQGKDHQDESGSQCDGAWKVESPVLVLSKGVCEEEEAREHDDSANRDIHVEDPLPAELLGEDAAEQDTECAARTGDRPPNTQGRVPLPTLNERHGQDGKGSGRQKRGPQPLYGTGSHQPAARCRQSTEERGRGEDDHARHEDPAPSQLVGHPPAEHEKTTEEKCVGIQHPQQVLFGEMQAALNRRQRDVHDRDIENYHELGHTDDRQGEPFARVTRHASSR